MRKTLVIARPKNSMFREQFLWSVAKRSMYFFRAGQDSRNEGQCVPAYIVAHSASSSSIYVKLWDSWNRLANLADACLDGPGCGVAFGG